MEANARLQVEHTVTEEVTGIDLVQSQIRVADGESLAELGLLQANIPDPKGFAVQLRINMETMSADGTVKPAGGRLSKFEVPTGPGLRTDTCGYAGYVTNPNYDSLLAKLVVSSNQDFAATLRRCRRALADFHIDGVATNIEFLSSATGPGCLADRPPNHRLCGCPPCGTCCSAGRR